MEDNFDPDKYLAEAPEADSFDPDSYLAESEAELTPQSELDSSTRAKLAGAAAYGAVETGKKAITGATGTFLDKIGVLTPEQQNLIAQSPEDYRKARPLEDLQESFRELGQQTRQRGFDARNIGVESLADLEPFKAKELIPALGRLEKAQKLTLSPEELPKARPNTAKMTRFENLLKQKQELESSLKGMTDTGIESFEMNKQINETSKRLEDINKQISKNIPNTLKEAISPSILPTTADFSKVTNLPPELLEVRPDLSQTKIPKEYGQMLQKEIDFLKTGEMTPKQMASFVKKAQEKASYTPFPTEEDKFKQEIARIYSEELKAKPGAELYAKGQEISKKAIELEKGFKEFGLGLDSENNVKVTNPKKLENLYKKGSSADISRFEKYVKEAQDLGINLENTMGLDVSNIDRFQTELPFASIKQTVETAKDLPGVGTAKRIAGSAVGGALGGIPGAIAGYTGATALPTGTKIQEAASLAKGSGAFKTAAKAAKFLGPAAGLATAGLTYAQGMEEGLSTPESAAIAGAEVLNPIPLTDTLQAYKAAKQEFEKEPGIVKPAQAAAKAFVKPMTELQTGIEQKAGMTGQELYKAERSASSPSKTLSDSKFENTSGPEMTKFADYLEQSPDKISQEYSRVIRQVISSPDREKSATLFSLNQNPAFRELAKKYKGEK